MTEQKDLSYFMKLDYEVIINKKDNFFCLIIPELSLFITDKNLERAYEKLDKEKKALFSKVIELNLLGKIIEPGREKKEKKLVPGMTELVPFFLKMLVVTIFLLTVGSFFIKPIGESIDKSISRNLNNSLSSLKNVPFEIVGSILESVLNRVHYSSQNDIFRIHIIGLKNHNPSVHYKASLLQEEKGNIILAIEEMELALGLLSMNPVDSEVKQIYKNRLTELRKMTNPAGETSDGGK